MTSPRFGTVLRQLCQQIGAHSTSPSNDSGLLARFVADRNEAAFAELVQRYGPLVLGVCRRVLRDHDDADDAFQATFLVLARKAAALDGRRPLAGWLYTVARNLALKHQSTAARRRVIEEEAIAMRSAEPADATIPHEACELLDAELGRLPEKYRVPLVLCYLQGMTHEAAARTLGWPAGSMAKRLARGLELLRERLAGRGAALSATGLAVLIEANASAAVRPALVIQISRAAAIYAAGQATAGLVSTQATALAGGAMHVLALSRWHMAAVVLLGASILGAGAAVFSHRLEGPEIAVESVPLEKPAPGSAAEDSRDQKVRKKLTQSVSLDRGIDANTPFQDVVDYLRDRYELTIRLDQEGFAAAGVVAVPQRFVSLPRLIGPPLETVLQLLLRQIEPLDGQISGYRIEKGILVLTPLMLGNRPIERFPRGLPERLFRPVRCDRQPFGMSLAEALDVYGKLYGQKLVLDRKAFADVGEPDAGKYPLAGRGRELPESAEPCLLEILDLILWQVDGATWESYVHVRDGAIEITAAKSESAQAKALGSHRGTVDEYRKTWEAIRRRNLRQNMILNQKASLEKGINPNTSLADVLEFLSDRYGLTILVDDLGFAAAGLDKVLERPIQLGPQIRVPLEEVLRRLLVQVGNDEYTAGLVRRDGYIEIVPEHNRLRQRKPLEARQLDKLWADLAGKSNARARLAGQTLVQASRQVLPYLKEHVKAVAPPDGNPSARVKKLLADLESDQFAVRQRATDELEKLGDDAAPGLRGQLAKKPSLEVRRRIEQILKRGNSEFARTLRAVRVLEAIGTAESRRLLEKLAAGERAAPPTRAARAALERLGP